MVGELLLAGIARDQREEMCGAAILPWPQYAAEPLGFLLPRPKGAGNLYEYVGVRQVDGEAPHLGKRQTARLIATEAPVDRFPLLLRRLAGDERSADFAGDGLHLGQVLTHDEDAPLRVDGEEFAQTGQFGGVFGGAAELRTPVGERLFHGPPGAYRQSLLDAGLDESDHMEKVLAAEAGAILSRQLSRQRRDNVSGPEAVSLLGFCGTSENLCPLDAENVPASRERLTLPRGRSPVNSSV